MPGGVRSPGEIRKLVDSFDWLAWSRDLAPDYEQLFADIVISSGAQMAEALGLDNFSYDDPFLQRHVTRYVGERIAQLTDTSKDAAIDVVTRALAAGEDLGLQELADSVQAAVEDTWEGYERYRALRIARTETSIAYNFGNLFAAHQAGVEKFEVSDGDDDEDCAAVDGDIVDLDWALANPIAHPNCTRTFSPVTSDEGDDETDD